MTDLTQTPPKGTEEPIIPKVDGTNGNSIVPPVKDGEGAGDPPAPTPTENPVEVPPVVTPTPVPQPVDYKKKFSESTRQNQIIVEQFKNLQNVLGDITKQEVPSEEEMRQIDPEWEYLDDRQKAMSMKMVVLERRSNLILKTVHDITFNSENATKLQDFINEEPRLVGKEDEFYAFATKPSNKGADVGVLLNAFLFEVRDTTPPAKDPQEIPPVDTPPSLERGSPRGGNPPIEQKTTYSDEEIAHMRVNDHKKYLNLVRTGKI